MNITDLVLQRARQQPDSIAFIDGERAVSYRELDRAVRTAAAGLEARGIGEGTRVAIDVTDAVRHLMLTLAIAKLRAVSVSMPDLPSAEERLAKLKALGVGHLLATAPVEGLEALELIVADGSLTRGQSAGRRAGYGPAADDLPWRIIWSSGSTGTPKPVLCTHGRTLSLMFAQHAVMPYLPGTTLYMALGPQVMFSLIHGLRAFAFGATLLGPARRTEQLFERCERHGVTHFVSSPAIASRLAALLQEDTPRLPAVQLYLGGGPVSPALRATLSRRFTPKIGVIYGTTETGMTALSDPQTFEAHPESAGRVAPWMQVEAVDRSDRPLAQGSTGLLRIRGIGMAREYMGDEAATSQMFRDGWFYPGDVGHVTPDGLLVVKGRSADVLSVGGNKIAPQAIEEALEQHPDVAEAAAFVASGSDGQQWLAAAVVSRGAFDQAALRDWCRERLGNSAPVMFVQVKSIPRGGIGKVLRSQLSRRFVVKGGTNKSAAAGDGES